MSQYVFPNRENAAFNIAFSILCGHEYVGVRDNGDIIAFMPEGHEDEDGNYMVVGPDRKLIPLKDDDYQYLPLSELKAFFSDKELKIAEFNVKNCDALKDFVNETITFQIQDLIDSNILTNPFENGVWMSKHESSVSIVLSSEEVREAIDCENRVSYKPISEWYGLPFSDARKFHTERVATLVLEQNEDPISIDLDSNGHPEITDGNHRIAALIFRKIPSVEVNASRDTMENLKRVINNLGMMKNKAASSEKDISGIHIMV